MLTSFATDIWIETRRAKFFGVETGTRMTIVRLSDGGLFVHSPVALDQETREGCLAERCGYDRHVSALARVERMPTFEQHRLEPTGRGLVAVTFDLDDRTGRGAAHAVHLDVREQQRKRSQVDAILAIAAHRSENFVVVGGDFNLDPTWANRFRLPMGDHAPIVLDAIRTS